MTHTIISTRCFLDTEEQWWTGTEESVWRRPTMKNESNTRIQSHLSVFTYLSLSCRSIEFPWTLSINYFLNMYVCIYIPFNKLLGYLDESNILYFYELNLFLDIFFKHIPTSLPILSISLLPTNISHIFIYVYLFCCVTHWS